MFVSQSASSVPRMRFESFRFPLVALFTIAVCTATDTAFAQTGTSALEEELRGIRRLLELQTRQLEALQAKVNTISEQLGTRGGSGVGRDYETPTSQNTSESVPMQPPANTHVVVKGETLTSIAKLHKTTIEELMRLNKNLDAKRLQIGQMIAVPPVPAPGAGSGEKPATTTGAPAVNKP
jgi:LysM repeat protein